MKARFDTAWDAKGVFWTKTSGNIYGSISYSPDDGIALELFRHPQPGGNPLDGANDYVPQMLGQLPDGTLVTLEGCQFLRSFGWPMQDILLITRFRVRRVLFGAHVDSINDLQVLEHRTELSSLASWTDSKPCNVERTRSEDGALETEITFRPPTDIDVPLSGRPFALRIEHVSNHSRSHDEVGIAWEAVACVISHKPMAFKDLNRIAGRWTQLLTLLIGKQTGIRAIKATIDQKPEDKFGTEVEIVWESTTDVTAKDLVPSDVMVPYALVADHLATIADKWFNYSGQAELATALLLSFESLEETVLDIRFVAATQAAEAYHRSLDSGFYMPVGEFEGAIRKLASSIPSEISGAHRKSLLDRLKFANEFSLRRRLKFLVERLPPKVIEVITGNDKSFVDKVVDTRNYFTHYDKSSADKALKGGECFGAAQRVHALVIVSFLHDFGLSDSDILKALRRNRHLWQWL